MGGVRQQFSTAAEVRLAQESIRFFEELGPPFFDQVGYLFLATTEAGLAELRGAARAPARRSAFPVETRRRRRASAACAPTTSLGAVACWSDGCADPAAVTRELVRRAVELGVELREHTDALGARRRRARDRLRRRGLPRSRPHAAASSCRCGRSAVSSSDGAAATCPRPADDRRGGDGLPLPPPRATGSCSRWATPRPRWGFDEARRRARVRGPARAARAPLSAGGRYARSTTRGRASTT